MRIQSYPSKMNNMLFQKDFGLPSMQIRITTDGRIEKFPNGVLYMLRSARADGGQRGCPKCSAASYEQASQFAQATIARGYTVFYYPFYTAICSGVALITNNSIVIEECNTDLWKLLDGTVNPDRVIIYNNARAAINEMDRLLHEFSPGLSRYVKRFVLGAEIDTIGFEYMYGYVGTKEPEFIILEVYNAIHTV